jgi:septum formation protein
VFGFIPADRIVLASASPRRAELLRAAGIEFLVRPADVDESLHDGEPPETYVMRVAEAKAHAIRAHLPDAAILAADTTVVVDHHVLGKPDGAEDAQRMLRLLSGRSHEVITGVVLVAPNRPVDARVASTTVEFAALTEEEIKWYTETGEPLDKAGAYAIQGFASRFVTRIVGSYSNVVGLPVALVYEMIHRPR